VWIQGEKISGNGEFGLRVYMGFVMIMINYKCSWRFPDGMIHRLILPSQLSALPCILSVHLEQLTVVLTLHGGG